MDPEGALTNRGGRTVALELSSAVRSRKKALGPSGSRTTRTAPRRNSSSLGQVIGNAALALGCLMCLLLILASSGTDSRSAKAWIGHHLRKSVASVVEETPPAEPAAVVPASPPVPPAAAPEPAAAPATSKEDTFCGTCQYREEPFTCHKKMQWSMWKHEISMEDWKKLNLKYCINTGGCDEQARGLVTCPGSDTSPQ